MVGVSLTARESVEASSAPAPGPKPAPRPELGSTGLADPFLVPLESWAHFVNLKLAAWIAGISLLTVVAYEAASSRDPRASALRSKVNG
jgi:hypothetical protein